MHNRPKRPEPGQESPGIGSLYRGNVLSPETRKLKRDLRDIQWILIEEMYNGPFKWSKIDCDLSITKDSWTLKLTVYTSLVTMDGIEVLKRFIDSHLSGIEPGLRQRIDVGFVCEGDS